MRQGIEPKKLQKSEDESDKSRGCEKVLEEEGARANKLHLDANFKRASLKRCHEIEKERKAR